MSRVTQSEQSERENEEQALGFFEQALGGLPDPRPAQGVRGARRRLR